MVCYIPHMVDHTDKLAAIQARQAERRAKEEAARAARKALPRRQRERQDVKRARARELYAEKAPDRARARRLLDAWELKHGLAR